MPIKLAVFDVDFTITKRETLFELYLFMLKKKPILVFKIPSLLGIALFYLFRFYDAKQAKIRFISFINGIEEEDMKRIVKEFYEKRLKNILYADAINMIKKMKNEGYMIYLISASAQFYLEEFYAIEEVDKVIGTRFKFENGKYNMLGENCKGDEKVLRLMETIKEEQIEVNFKSSYMFSDSLSDLPLFKLVGNPYLINYRKNHEYIKILKWK